MTMPTLTPLPQRDFRRTPWKNGGGMTIDITGAYRPGAEAGSWAGTIWRLGRTAITAPAPFSDLTGYQRMQVVIAGSGLVLEATDHEIDLRMAFQPVRYDGGLPLVSRLEHGPVEVINLIADHGACAIDLVVLDGKILPLTAGTHILYALRDDVSGSCGDIRFTVTAGDALRLDATADFILQVDTGPSVLASIDLK